MARDGSRAQLAAVPRGQERWHCHPSVRAPATTKGGHRPAKEAVFDSSHRGVTTAKSPECTNEARDWRTSAVQPVTQVNLLPARDAHSSMGLLLRSGMPLIQRTPPRRCEAVAAAVASARGRKVQRRRSAGAARRTAAGGRAQSAAAPLRGGGSSSSLGVWARDSTAPLDRSGGARGSRCRASDCRCAGARRRQQQ